MDNPNDPHSSPTPPPSQQQQQQQQMSTPFETTARSGGSSSSSSNNTATATRVATMTKKKELVLRVAQNGFVGAIDDLEEHHTLQDVRERLVDEFGEENLPCSAPSAAAGGGGDSASSAGGGGGGGVVADFLFQRPDGVMVSRKQESRKRAWDYVDGGEGITIVTRCGANVLSFAGACAGGGVGPSPTKKARTATAQQLMKVEDQGQQQQPPPAPSEGKETSAAAATSTETTKVAPGPAPRPERRDDERGAGAANSIPRSPALVPQEAARSATASPSAASSARRGGDVEVEGETGNAGAGVAAAAAASGLKQPPPSAAAAAAAAAASADFSGGENNGVTLDHGGDDDISTTSSDDNGGKKPAARLKRGDGDDNGNDDADNNNDDPHKVQKDALAKSSAVLRMIKENVISTPLFCSDVRRAEMAGEIDEALRKSASPPQLVVGVLGNTGVGKSSLLNALLDEASVLPTSGSRGCTAAVVELRFNGDLRDFGDEEGASSTTKPAYKGEVEFITVAEWAQELQLLIDECSTHEEKTIYVRVPEPQRQPDASAAWQKLNEVYGHGTMEKYCGQPKGRVFDRLSNDARVNRLLTPREGSNKQYNAVIVEEGAVGEKQAKELLAGFAKMGGRLKRLKKRWAGAFRAKINDYVYRKGNGKQPQTWPLIRKVVLEGPWSVLASGACLVDLPGVRDANAARAKVSQHYLQHCSQIWVVAPIKRAVDDGTAKELLGEQFKRRLLMDGQYGNVSFICTQTDDCEATEIMRDHEDVAKREPGRWEKMTELLSKITEMEQELNEKALEEEDLKTTLDEIKASLKDAESDLQEEMQEMDADPAYTANPEILESLQRKVDRKKRRLQIAENDLGVWQVNNQAAMNRLKAKSERLQRRLKAICANVRNEYSKACLQEDFRDGLKELCRGDGENDSDDSNPSTDIPLPEDFEMEVYCISANDYLKIEEIKPSSDGPPSCFSRADDTQIPALRSFVHQTTASYRKVFTNSFVELANDMLERVKLIAAGSKNVPGGRSSRRCLSVFENEMSRLKQQIKSLADEFLRKANSQVQNALYPSVRAGAQKGQASALSTVESWGSKNRRNRHERRPDKNGLYYSTYQATLRRGGEYVSGAAGEINFNEELCAPMEKEFSSDWQRTMDATISVLLRECETKVISLCTNLDRSLVTEFTGAGADPGRLQTMANTASRTCSNAVKAAFLAMKNTASSSQRDLNRSLLPLIKSRMDPAYSTALTVQRGAGTFNRMKHVLQTHTGTSVSSIFSQSTNELMCLINNMLLKLQTMVSAVYEIIWKSLENVYSVMWDDQKGQLGSVIDPSHQLKVQACRDKLLPALNELRKLQDAAMNLLGIKREEAELDVLAVDTWEQQLVKKIDEAKRSGDFIDLCDSDEELDIQPKLSHASKKTRKVKAEPGRL